MGDTGFDIQQSGQVESIQPAVMTLASVMKSPVISIDMDSSLSDALELCQEKRIRHLPVLGETGKLVGILTDRDIRFHISPRLGTLSENNSDRATLQRPIHLLMCRKVVAGTPDLSVAVAAARMLKYRVGCLPVVDDEEHVVGIVTESDFLMLLAAFAPPQGKHPLI